MAKNKIEFPNNHRDSSTLAYGACIAVIFLSFTTISLLILLLMILPLQSKVPFLITFKNKEEQVVHIEPLSKKTTGYKILCEKLAKQFVLLVESINDQTHNYRWKKLQYFTEKKLFNEFLEKQELKKIKINRKIKILHATSLQSNKQIVWKIKWKAQDFQQKKFIQEKVWISILTTEIAKQTRSFNQQFENPIGFIVTAYQVRNDDD